MIHQLATSFMMGIGFAFGLSAFNAAPRAVRSVWTFIMRLN